MDDVTSGNTDMILGELRGQLREVIHGMNNVQQTVQVLTREVGLLSALTADVGALKAKAEGMITAADIATLKADVEILKGERHERRGASNTLLLILKSPTLGWLIGAAITAWAILTGKVQLP